MTSQVSTKELSDDLKVSTNLLSDDLPGINQRTVLMTWKVSTKTVPDDLTGVNQIIV